MPFSCICQQLYGKRSEMATETICFLISMDETIKENDMKENDDIWVYVNCDENNPNILELTKQQDDMMHLVWPTDSL